MDDIIYPTVELITYYNTIAIEMFRKSKHDQAITIEAAFIRNAIETVQNAEGDLHDKAAVLLQRLTQAHAFESGNKRTAFLSTKKFVLMNHGKFNIPDSINNAKVMIGIRENYYTRTELRMWIEHGKIKEFRR